jgi:hypothetical protein
MLPSRSLFFVLGLFAAGLSFGLVDLVGIPATGVVTGLALIGVAEALIRGRRLFASGIEEALWSAGAAMIAFELFDLWRPVRDAAGLLLVATALALALARGMFEGVKGAGQACFGLAFGARRCSRRSPPCRCWPGSCVP